MRSFFFVLLIIFAGCKTKNDSSKLSSEISKIQSECSLRFENKQPVIEIHLINQQSNNVYLFLSYWEVNGLKDSSDVLFGYPTDKYIVNQIRYYPKTMKGKSIKYIGEKSVTPSFRNLPKVLKLGKNEPQKFVIKLTSPIIQTLDIDQYNFYFFISYTTEKIWKSMEKKLGKEVLDAIILSNKIEKEISIPSVNEVYIYEMSEIENTYTLKDFSFYNIFKNWIKGECSINSN